MNMRKWLIVIMVVLLLFCSTACTVSNSFKIDLSDFSFSSNSKKDAIKGEFNKNYNLTYSILSSNEELKSEINVLSKKVTYLLLGEKGTSDESEEEYYKRRNDYLSLRYAPEIPKDPNSFTGFDENSQEYIDDVVSGISVPGMFNLLDELNVVYDYIGSIRISVGDDMIVSMVSLPSVKIKVENVDDPMNYKVVDTNLILYYYFKSVDDEYKLYYVFGETTNDLSEYFDNIENSEMTKSISISKNYDSQLNDIYDFSKLNSIDDNKLSDIYNANLNNILLLNAYYNTDLVTSANGFFINDGLVVTTWNFLEKALIESQFFVIKNIAGTVYEMEGIVTINPEADIAVIKLKQEVPSSTKLGNIENMDKEDPVVAISSKTGVGLTIQTGIITFKDEYIQTTLPLSGYDEGSPLYNLNGEVIGINTSKSVNVSLSMAVDSKALEEVKTKFSNIEFESIDTVTFDSLKEKYYYVNHKSENVINSIPLSKWKKFKNVGDIENTVKLELVKASYDNNVISLRYYNGISKYISGMQLATSFKKQLQNDGYTQTLDSSSKCIYMNNKYKVVIIDEFDYLIVVMVEL